MVKHNNSLKFKIHHKHRIIFHQRKFEIDQTTSYQIDYQDGMFILQDLNQLKKYKFPDSNLPRFEMDDHKSYLEYKEKLFPQLVKLDLLNDIPALICVLPLSEYLYGVVNGEIGPREEKYLEALKAQAVIARTYYLHLFNENPKNFLIGYQTQHQVYKFDPHYQSVIKKSVNETEKQILTENNQPILAVYSADCGGFTESSYHVWGDQKYPYLESHWDGLSYENEHCSVNKNHYWEITYNQDQLNQILQEKLFLNQDETVKKIRILERTPSGRVKKMQISSQKKNYLLAKEKIRFILRNLTTGKILPSRLFELEVENQFGNTVYHFKGIGNGHGVGLCQYGAMGMSEKNIDFKKILNFYYPETKLTQF